MDHQDEFERLRQGLVSRASVGGEEVPEEEGEEDAPTKSRLSTVVGRIMGNLLAIVIVGGIVGVGIWGITEALHSTFPVLSGIGVLDAWLIGIWLRIIVTALALALDKEL